ncbi:MAG: hypothetical protein PHC50_09615, partial [Candidatus Cloacimonetes bacterium]|nr:hypothetical protein [Candidatus Cloacimonadota bacterium]
SLMRSIVSLKECTLLSRRFKILTRIKLTRFRSRSDCLKLPCPDSGHGIGSGIIAYLGYILDIEYAG